MNMNVFLIVLNYDIPLVEKECKGKLRELFLKNKYVTDLRAIDLLVVKVRSHSS